MSETKNTMRLNELFEELVPASGKADSLAGELVRAASKIGYRFFNDGDQIGIGYGKETCNAPARFLIKRGGDEIAEAVAGLWGLFGEREYETKLDTLVGLVVDYVESHPELRNTATDDMLDYEDPYEDRDDEEEDEDEYASEDEDEYEDEE